jgi:hypothetical protein
MIKYPIAIATKGRPDGSTMKMLDSEGVAYTLFVEPQDAELYCTYKNVVVIDENDKGLWYVRNKIIEYYQSKGATWVWVLDDDIKYFKEVIAKRCVNIPAKEMFDRLNTEFVKDYKAIVQLGLAYSQFAWSATKRYSLDKVCDCCVCINVSKLGAIKFREMDFKVDRDFTLQILSKGKGSMLINQFAFVVPKNGSNKGGLHAKYHTEGLEEKASRDMIKKWPKVCTFNLKKDGRPDVKINWSYFKRK